MQVILMFPGQGSQKPGMGRDLFDAYPAARAAFEEVDSAVGAPISTLCFQGPEANLTSTQNAQPALLAHGAAAWAVLRDQLAERVVAAAGHSLGEFTAQHAAGTLALADAARLVRRRGELMYESGVNRPGAMAAILGLGEDKVEQACMQASAEAGAVVPANYNTPEQLVISGEVSGVERAMALCKEAGAKRALRLNVSGAFHSPLMEVAATGLREALSKPSMGTAAFPVYSNVTAEPARDADDVRSLLLRQLTNPVRWTQQVQRMATDHPDALWVEVGPGNVLGNLVKRIVPGVQTATAGTAAEIDQLSSRVAA
ncbi:MAG: ACP S-malonyltransferase [Gemmatimonadota bacterium]|nr:ACP S-malonyltransferase [Gemmatimonadota bacterium]